jgi:triacylglycerol esterase/lipase EstA (alpha/beta hydrolase family)
MVSPRRSVALHFARAGEPPVRIEDVADDDVVELELQDGLRVWTRVQDLEADFGIVRARDAADPAIQVPTMLRVGGGPSRGTGEWAIKALKVFGLDIAGGIADFVRKHVEGRLKPGPGLYRCTSEGPLAFARVGRIGAEGPTLVFLHGTASSTEGSFGGLWENGASAHIHRLLGAYGGRVLAFQHRTLSESPIENAATLLETLAEALPKGASVHLVSHSRGGLVGELLARGMRIGGAAVDREDLARFEDRPRDREALERLRKAAARCELKVERFVRVACPARGTTLADRRLDRYFGILTNIVGLVPSLRASPLYDGLTSLLAGVLKKRTDPAELPGLEAMMPTSPLVRMLNRPDVQTGADLHVLGGDLEGVGAWGRLKTLATDFFYLEDHDLVVNTRSMFGGVERSKPVKYWIDAGGNVTHFNYFRNADTATRLVAALQAPGDADYHTLEARTAGEVTAGDYQKRAGAAQPIVLVLPGIMGSNLSVAGGPVWMDYLRLSLGGLARLRMDARSVLPSSLVADGYKALVRHLSLTHDVVPFPYDWRLSVEDAAEKLRRELLKQLDRAGDQPVRIIAHSMGGLVARAMIGSPRGQEAWDRMCEHPGARLVMMGTPSGGSHSIAALLLGRDALAKKLALLDVTHSHAELMAIIASFDGVLNLLPYDGGLDLFDTKVWQDLYEQDVPAAARGLGSPSAATSKSAGIAWTVPDKQQLASARRVAAAIRKSPINASRMIYVAGIAKETPCAVAVDKSAPAGSRVTVLATARGDGRVPWATGIPEGLQGRTYYMDAVHGDLASAEAHFPALVDLLTIGATTKLPQAPPAGRGAADDWFVMRSPDPEMLPDAEDLVASALGASARRQVNERSEKVRVRVVHGNLSHARAPVVVGHYEQDAIVSAEAYVDRQLDGRLGELLRMDLYPGKPGTASVVLNEPGPGVHPGAIVVGLGFVGDLTPGTLIETLTHGLTAYGAERVGWARRRRQAGLAAGAAPSRVDAPVTVVLVGSGEAGLTLSDALLAILRSVRQANERLRAAVVDDGRGAPPGSTAFIGSVDIQEIYLDRAIQAARTLNHLAETAEVREDFVVEALLVSGAKGERRVSYEEPPGWAQRLRITSEAGGGLRFEAATNRARVASFVGLDQKRSAELFLARAAGTTSDPSLGYTLFEILVPPSFKEYAPERQRLVLMLDADAASLPWELLQDRYDRGSRPMSVEAGMIRQLLIGSERRREPIGDTALVIGNPPVSDERFPRLPGAEREASAVVDRLSQQGYEVTALLGDAADPQSVLAQIHERPWKILHLAGHGVFDFRPTPEAPPVSGMVLDHGMFLTPSLLSQMRFAPRLVFVNCCHLGETRGETQERRLPHLAANVATEFMKIGTRIVVAAGWAVDDTAARDFAVRFYDEMLLGAPFSDAVRLARAEGFENHGHTNTWGAYQCYGDAAFTLRSRRDGATPLQMVSAPELAIAAGNLAAQVGTATPKQRSELLARLDNWLSHAPPEWLQDSSVCGAVGRAYGELKEFEKSIAHLERLSCLESGDGLGAIEQLANFKARWAERLASAARSKPGPRARRPAALPAASARLFEEADELLRYLIRLGPTSERYALLGSLHKRRAMASTGRERRTALARMANAYGTACALARSRQTGNAWYPLLNQLSAEVVLSWRRGRRGRGGADPAAEAVEEGLAELQRAADGLSASSSDFWELALAGDRQLLAALWRRRLEPRSRGDIEAAYRLAAQRSGSPRELDSVAGQIEFYARMVASESPKKGADGLAGALAELRQALAGPS